MARRVVVIVGLLLGGCDDDRTPVVVPIDEVPSEPECDFEAVLDEALASTVLADCGDLTNPYELESWEHAEQVWLAGLACVRDHLDRRDPFVVRFHPPLVDYGNHDNLYVGREIAGVWSIQMFVEGSDGTFTTNDVLQTYATSYSCDDLGPREEGRCMADDFLFLNLCFECTNATKTSECKTN